MGAGWAHEARVLKHLKKGQLDLIGEGGPSHWKVK